MMFRSYLVQGLLALSLAVVLLDAEESLGAEPTACLSMSPTDWPMPAKPYVLILADTSYAMDNVVTQDNTCGYPKTKNGHLRCALKNIFQNWSGYVRFGLMTFAVGLSNCSESCFTGCSYTPFPGDSSGCGPEPDPVASNSSSRRGGNLVVPVAAEGGPTNIAQVLKYTDNSCGDQAELFAAGTTPTNGIMRDAFRYLSDAWVSPATGTSFYTPLGGSGELACRQVIVVLLVKGPDLCDSQVHAVAAAKALFDGFTIGGITWKVKVHVIRIGADITQAEADAMAAAGGTGSATSANSDVEIQDALSNIITGVIGTGEACDNTDNNCNGCTDEGYLHYGNVQPVAGECCTQARATCLALYKASISPSQPNGDVKLLPCTTAAQATSPATWLCYDPGEKCDNVDNNMVGGVDEGIIKCGNPQHCPTAEVCNGEDDDCDGLIDEGVCSGCVPTPEVCDGCDNDCDGVIDEGIAQRPCGLASPANCVGTQSCKPAVPAAFPGACAPGGGWSACTNSPQGETCDSVDNDCNGLVDDAIAAAPCVPAGTPPVLVYGGTSQCKMGIKQCNSMSCVGFVGPSQEVCDGVDNDCDGQIDEGALGVGLACGQKQPPCTQGITGCVNGNMLCQGGVPPKSETCDGVDNDCDGQVDNGVLLDAPPAWMSGCWNMPGNCCSFGQANWCPPPGATCHGMGALTSPCSSGRLVCKGAAGYQCVGVSGPSSESCNNRDDNCNGVVDGGYIAGMGAVCGSSEGLCKLGALSCESGVVKCKEGILPAPEICDGEDNDCDGVVDDGLSSGEACWPTYDVELYPGMRQSGQCRRGVAGCSSSAQEIGCIGATAPSPETCDGLDNDCDGQIDEEGAAPDGLSDTQDGEEGVQFGAVCKAGAGDVPDAHWECRHGAPYCPDLAQPERCDGLDNDGDGVVDEEPGDGEPVLCGPGTRCVRSGDRVLCAAPCLTGSQQCPGGQECISAVASSDPGEVLPDTCVPRLPRGPSKAGSVASEEVSGRFLSDGTALAEGVATTGGLARAGSFAPTEPIGETGIGGKEPVGAVAAGVVGPTKQTDHDYGGRPAWEEDNSGAPDQGEALNGETGDTPAPEGRSSAVSGGCTTGGSASGGGGVALLLALVAFLALGIRGFSTKRFSTLVVLVASIGFGAACSSGSGSGESADVVDQQGGDGMKVDGVTNLGTTDQGHQKDQADWSGGTDVGGDPGGADNDQGDTAGDSGSDSDWGDGEVTDPGDVIEEFIEIVDVLDVEDVEVEDVGACPDADLYSPQTCGACDNNCLEEVPQNANAEFVVCQWEGDWQEPGECLYPVCLPGWRTVGSGDSWCDYLCTISGQSEDVCDGVDDDCDEAVDEDVDPCGLASCGGCEVGRACVADNVLEAECVAVEGVCLGKAYCGIVECSPGYVDLDDEFGTGCEYPCSGVLEFEEVCDGLDDDCNGEVDEAFDFYSVHHCGGCHNNCFENSPNADVTGVQCAWSGVMGEPGLCSFEQCAVNYHDLDDAQAGCETYCVVVAPDDAICDGRDDDCDGVVDEDVDFCSLQHCGACGVECIKGVGVVSVECRESGETGCAGGASCVIAACVAGRYDLDGDAFNGCEYACSPAGPELCDGLDNDCNGLVDDDPDADPVVGMVCFGGASGLCATPKHAGALACFDGRLECSGANLLKPGLRSEICNNVDDDCNGVVDDFPQDVGAICGGVAEGVCGFGTQKCVNGVKVCDGVGTPSEEICNGIDDDCDGEIDATLGAPPADSVGDCSVPIPPPAGATSPCKSGTKVCFEGRVQCQDAVLATSTIDFCGVDANCDGVLTAQPDLSTDVVNCGSCGNNCYAGAVHSLWSCQQGSCAFQGCQAGYYDLDGDKRCEYPCTYLSQAESCNGVDDNCNGMIDEGVVAPTPVAVCGVAPEALSAECTSMVQVACSNGAWKCTFAAGICFGGCGPEDEICDNLDNDCDGLVDEGFPGIGGTCYSDDGLPAPGHGLCRTSGTRVCDGPGAVKCSAVKADCATLAGGCTELCDGLDNDCDGLVDENYVNKGTNGAFFVKPVVTKAGSSLWVYSYEASRPNATSVSAGVGNGYWTSAPSGTIAEKTRACSAPGKVPWFNVTLAEAEQTCTAMGGYLCSAANLTTVCSSATSPACLWGYNPRGAACRSVYTASKFCNISPSFDAQPLQAGLQDGLLPTASGNLQNCWADWSNLQGNTAATNKVYDITGNLAELTRSSPSQGLLMGGSFVSDSEAGATCVNTTVKVPATYFGQHAGFRCCFSADPTL